MDNADKIILDLCGGSGSWSRPYKDAGYDVRVITLPEYDVRTYQPPENVYGILAAPPCTEFSIAKNGRHRQRNFDAGLEIVESCLHIIWNCRSKGKLRFWALENPTGYLRQFLGRPAFTFYQWEFGVNSIKHTDIWGYFHEPKRIVTERPDNMNYIKTYKIGKSHQFDCPEWVKSYIEVQADKRAALRAITPMGFAQAFFKANR